MKLFTYLETRSHDFLRGGDTDAASGEGVVNVLQQAGCITGTAADPPRLLPAHFFGTITVKEFPDAFCSAEVEPGLGAKTYPHDAGVESLFLRLDVAADESLRRLHELVLAGIEESSSSAMKADAP